MTTAFDTLPWRLSSIACLFVAAVTLVITDDVWVILIRAGIAFAVFWVIGYSIRYFFKSTSQKQVERHGHSQHAPVDSPPAETDSTPSPINFEDLP
ncbi:MAG TPA: hypothetical protein VGK19_05455 [Capsulimonadaceae bacterium]